MRNFIKILAVIILMLLASGCYELIASGDKATITTSVSALMVSVDEFQNVFEEAAAANLMNAEETKKRNDQIDKIQEVVVAANTAIKESPTLIEGVIKANQASAPVNPYAGVIDAVLKIIAGTGVLGGTAAVVKIVKDGKARNGLTQDLVVVKDKYKATNRANEKLRIQHPEIAREHYELVGAERSGRNVTFAEHLKPDTKTM